MKPLRLSAAAAAATCMIAALIPATSSAVVPPVDSVGRPAQIRCGTSPAGAPIFAAHADKIIFTLSGAIQAQLPADQAALNAMPRNTELDIKVLDNPLTVAGLKGKVLTFIGAVNSAPNRAAVKIIDVDYAMVCPTFGPN